MYLEKLKLWNFRKYGSGDNLSTLDLDNPDLIVPFKKGLNVLIGENDSGKTAIIDAIKLVLKTNAYEWIRVEESDFYKNEATVFRIELEFSDFQESEAKHFTEWLGWKVFENEEKQKVRKPILRLIYQVTRNENRILPADVRAGMDDDGLPLDAEAKEYLKCTYLRPLRDAEHELVAKRNSRLSQILREYPIIKENEEKLINIVTASNEKIEDWFKEKENGADDQEKENILSQINSFIHDFIGDNVNVELKLSSVELKSILESINIALQNTLTPGLGSFNRLYMAVELLYLTLPDRVLNLCMIEELEAHLHPQAQMRIIESLRKRSVNYGIQFFLTTHSPNLASKVKLHELIFCNANQALSLGDGLEKKNKKTEDSYTKLNRSDYQFLEHFLDVTKSNLFFAKGIIIVEGMSEELLIPVLAELIGLNLTEREISIVNVGSTAYLRYAKIFMRQSSNECFNIPIAIITDLDIKPKEPNYEYTGDQQDLIKEKKTKKEAEIGLEPHDCIRLCISELWTLEWCLFKTNYISYQFMEAVSEVHSRTPEFKKNKHETTEKLVFDEKKFRAELFDKLKDKSLDKVAIANRLALKLKGQTNIKDNLLEDNSNIKYIIDAIKYACGEEVSSND